MTNHDPSPELPDDRPTGQHRVAVVLLEQAASELGLRCERFCQDWVVRLVAPDGRARLVWGYNFDLNPSAGALVARDKVAAFEALRAAGVPAIEHRLFLRADLAGYAPESGSWRGLLAAFDEFGRHAVIKPVEGSGGAGVTRVRSERELELASAALWKGNHAICLSPFVRVAREVRHVLLDGEPWIVYEKDLDSLVGDGRSTLGELIAARAAAEPERWDSLLSAAARAHGDRGWNEVPPAGERLGLAWKHNLRGAQARLLEPPEPALLKVAQRGAAALGLRICSADVVLLEGESAPRVMEINAGLMLERFVEQVEGGWERAGRLTMQLVRRMFDE